MKRKAFSIKRKELSIKPVPVPAGYVHPPCPFPDVLPTHEFTMGIIAPPGCGKTTVIVNIFDFYEKYFHTILVFSPSIESDEKWDYVKERELLAENTDLLDWIKKEKAKKKNKSKIIEEVSGGTEVENLIQKDKDKKFTGLIPEECFFEDYLEDELMDLMAEQKGVIKVLKKHKQPKYLANRILIIFDDLVGSGLFSGTKGSFFKGLNTRRRHYSTSMIMISQGYKEIPKTIRTSWTCLIVFEIGNEKEIEVIYEEFPMGLSKITWNKAYRYCTSEEHGFMFIDFQKERGKRIMHNFDTILTLPRAYEENDEPVKRKRKRKREEESEEEEEFTEIK